MSSDNANNREIEILNRQINNIFNKLAEIERSERQVLGEKKEAIITLAKIFERQYELGEYKKPLDTICAHICKLARDKYHLLASERWIHKVLEDIKDDNGNKKYLQSEFDPTVFRNDQTIRESVDLLTEFSLGRPEIATDDITDDLNIKKIANKSLDELRTPDEIKIATEQELRKADKLKTMARETAKRAGLLVEKCDRLGIKYEAEDESDVSEANKIPVESAISAYSGPSRTSQALFEYADAIKRAAMKVEKYPPSTEMDAVFAECINRMIRVWRGWVDEKYRKDTISWLHVAMDKAAHGKHAAATMHATVLPNGTKRALTREQVGDKDELVLQQAMNILAMQDDIAAMHRWYVEGPEKAIANRAQRLHKRLSNSA